MKSNDDIPEDEMLLAAALAAAKSRGWKHTTGAMFRNERGTGTVRANKFTVACCALGALAAAGVDKAKRSALTCAINSNDGLGDDWWTDPVDAGESLGWAFRCAMEEP